MKKVSKIQERIQESRRASKQHIFDVLNITDPAPWQDMTPQEIITRLSRYTGWSIQEIADRLNEAEKPERPILPWHLNLMAVACNVDAKNIDRFMRVLKPRLEELVAQGLLLPESFSAKTQTAAKADRLAKIVGAEKAAYALASWM